MEHGDGAGPAMDTAAPSTAGSATWLWLPWHGCCQPSCCWGRGRAMVPCTCPGEHRHPRDSPAARRGRGQRGTGWQRQARCAGRALHHGRGGTACGLMAVPPSAPAEGPALLWGQRSPTLCRSPAHRGAGQPVRAPEPTSARALPLKWQQQSTPTTMPLLCCHGTAREQPGVLWPSRMFSAQAARQLAEVPAASQHRLSHLPW